ncbi:MAG: RNA polymerase sigma factor [Acidobacteriota bacterium]|jgi:RNA polymerase sigma-70 factor (ECF subfamily)
MASSGQWEGGWDVVLGSAQAPDRTTDSDVIDLSTLVHAYAALLFRVAHSILHNRAESEDLVQDVFLRVVERRTDLPEVRNLRAWLIRITWNLALDRRRQIRPEQLDEPFAASLAAATVPADQALGETRQIVAVLNAIQRLPKQERHALLLSTIDELSITEISAILRRSESAVRALIFRARTRLRQRMERGANP